MPVEPGAAWGPECSAVGDGTKTARSGVPARCTVAVSDKHGNPHTKGGARVVGRHISYGILVMAY